MTSASFGLMARQLDQLLRERKIGLLPMLREPALEPRMVAPTGFDDIPEFDSGQASVDWRESDDRAAISVAVIRTASPLRYFLDGVQRTMPAYHAGAVPIVAAISAAGIASRSGDGSVSLLSKPFASSQAWLVPNLPGNAALDEFRCLANDRGMQVLDSLSDRLSSRDREHETIDYFSLEQRAFDAARILRSNLESDLLQQWSDSPLDDCWLVADGVLREPVPRAIGLVKSFTSQYMDGNEAVALFELPVGHRTPAFRVTSLRRGSARVMWYVRMRNADGRDPRHALVRIEANGELTDVDRIDQLSAALLAERAPTASLDPRSATLIYPIHLLERMLTGHLNAQLRGWPAARD